MKLRTLLSMLLAAAMLFSLAACAKTEPSDPTDAQTDATEAVKDGVTELTLTGDGVRCDSGAVYAANDIIYYEAGHDAGYGAGEPSDAHTAEEAAAHTVVHITAPGTYHVTGSLKGQLFVDLGEDAKKDENARVTLLLDGAEIACDVAPAVLFYRVYECADKETFTLTPDLTNAGAVVVLQNENSITGSHVAKIYKEGTTDKLYKFDGAFYSRQSLRIEGDGVLNITADNEGLNSELHLEIDGGEINIFSQDDGVNTNEDGISVTTINGGNLNISGGNGDEGDGIDSNGAIVVNGGSLYASANPQTGDGGIDADLGIYLNGGTVIATGSRNDEISYDSKQVLMDLTFAQAVKKGAALTLSTPILDGETEVFAFTAKRDFSALVISVPALQLNVPYALRVDGVMQQHGGKSGMQPGMGGGRQPGEIPDPNDGAPPEKPAGEGPENAPPAPQGGSNELPIIPVTPSDVTPPSSNPPAPPAGDRPTPPDQPGQPGGGIPGQSDLPGITTEEVSAGFTVTADNHTFVNVTADNHTFVNVTTAN